MPQQIQVGNDILEFPDGMTDDQIKAVLAKEYGASKQSASTQKPPSTEELARDEFKSMSRWEQALVGTGAGMRAAYLGAKQLFTDDDSEAGKEVQAQIDAERPYMDQTFSTGYGIGGNIAPYLIGGSLIPVTGAKGAAAVGAGLGLLQPTRSDENAAVPVLLGAGGGYVGQKVAGAASRGIGRVLGKGPVKAPTIGALRQQSQNLYNTAKAQGVTINKDSFGRLVASIENDLMDKGLDPDITQKAFKALNRLKQSAASPDPLTWRELSSLREVANNVRIEPRREGFLAGRIVDKLDDFVNNLSSSDISSGNANVAARATKEARELWKRKTKAETIASIMERAEDTAGANYASAGYQTAIRQGFKAIKRNDKLFKRFSPQEQELITKIIRGDTVENTLRHLGKLAPRGKIGQAFTLGTTAYNPFLGIPLWGLGEVTKGASTGRMLGNLNALDDMVRRGAPLIPQKLPAPLVGGSAATAAETGLIGQRKFNEAIRPPALIGNQPEALPPAPPAVNDDLFNRVIQQESGGRQSAISPKGAVGVAQVMPGTAPEAAKLAGVEFDEERYRNDAEYNAMLGRAYLNKQLQDYGSPALALAAYNAGPGRLQEWLQTIGDPRRGDLSEAEFVRQIPFAETRNYVSRILSA